MASRTPLTPAQRKQIEAKRQAALQRLRLNGNAVAAEAAERARAWAAAAAATAARAEAGSAHGDGAGGGGGGHTQADRQRQRRAQAKAAGARFNGNNLAIMRYNASIEKGSGRKQLWRQKSRRRQTPRGCDSPTRRRNACTPNRRACWPDSKREGEARSSPKKQLEALEEDITQLFASTHRRIEEEQERAADEEEEWDDDDDDDEMYANLGIATRSNRGRRSKKTRSSRPKYHYDR